MSQIEIFFDIRRRLSPAVSGLAISFVLVGCVVGPDYERPSLLMPPYWSGNGNKEAVKTAKLSHWWKRFNDPTLTALVNQAMENNRSVDEAKSRVREARAVLRHTSANLFLTSDAAFSLSRLRTASTEDVGASTTANYRSGLDASWEIDLFGGKRRANESARYGVNIAEEDLRNTMLVLIGDVALNYAQARASQARSSLARRTARSQRESAVLTRAKREAGTAGVADVANAEALAATTEADIPSFEITATQAIHRLSVLIGQPPSTLSEVMRKSAHIPQPKLPLPVGIPSDVLHARPDVSMAEFALARATAKIGNAEAARYPSVSLTGNIATEAFGLSEFGKKSTIAWVIGPSITLPIIRAAQLKGAADAARASRDESFAAYQSAVLTAMEDVENAIVALSQQRVRGQKLSSAIESYRTAANASRAKFEAGAIGYLELLDAQRALYAS